MAMNLGRIGMWVAVACLTAGCIDPGSGPDAGATPQSALPGAPQAATLSWQAPTSNTDGTALTDLVGYRIYYGTTPEDLNYSVQIKTIGLQTYVVEGLERGTWYFAIMALAGDGSESALSEVVSKTIS